MHPTCCPILEFRRYTLHPGRRDVLIEVFEREFIESQEALGMALPGLFRVEDDEDKFVWLRGFANMESRATALAAFYGGPVWKAHREAANATMIDSDDVHLLHPTAPAFGFPRDTTRLPPGRFLAATWAQDDAGEDAFAARFGRNIQPALQSIGATIVATLATEHSPNNFPALPVRGDRVFVCFALLRDGTTRNAVEQMLDDAAELLLLAPTARSKLRG